jgi:ABC-type transport system involved in multi-copper enzyme maturation permease subunit
MLKALVIKELRESVGIVALAVLGTVYALSELTGLRLLQWGGRSLNRYPFIYDELTFYLSCCAGALAVALAMKQTAWELGQGTYFFLFHRPVSRTWIIACKLAVGTLWVVLLSALMILVYAWWVATPGHITGPFFWSMTAGAWRLWVALPVVYLSAFLAGIRPAKWFGSRLVPVVAAIAVVVIAANMPWLWLSLLISAIAAAAYLVSIFYYVRRRDY